MCLRSVSNLSKSLVRSFVNFAHLVALRAEPRGHGGKVWSSSVNEYVLVKRKQEERRRTMELDAHGFTIINVDPT